MKEHFPTVSVIIPTFNYKQFIANAIDSIRRQTYPQELIEIIIIDDGSMDGTEQFVSSLHIPNLIYRYQENKGKSAATQYGLDIATGTYIFNLDADDFFMRDKIEKFVGIFMSNHEVVHVGSAAKILNAQHPALEYTETIPSAISEKAMDGNAILSYFYQHNILLGGGSTFAAKKAIFDGIRFPEGIDMYTDEFLVLVALSQGKSFLFATPYSIWRVHGNNYSAAQQSKEAVLEKGGRLLRNSSALLHYVNTSGFFSDEIKKRFNIIHENRIITYIENLGEKKFSDKLRFFKSISGKNWPGWSMVKSYKFFNRFIPSFIFKALKKTQSK